MSLTRSPPEETGGGWGTAIKGYDARRGGVGVEGGSEVGVGSYALYAGVVEEGNALHWGHCSVYLGGDVLNLGLDGQEFLLEAALVVHC